MAAGLIMESLALSDHSLFSQIRWASARALFISVVTLSLSTVVMAIPFAPYLSWAMFGDWRFWRYLRRVPSFFRHGWRVWGLMFRGEGSFMLGVPLTSAPRTNPKPGVVTLSVHWEHGSSCGSCLRCCLPGQKNQCPVLDPRTGQCDGYDAFFWRYFNCGRYPSTQEQIDYYGCAKWVLAPSPAVSGELPAPAYVCPAPEPVAAAMLSVPSEGAC